MQLRVGYELIYDCPQPTPMMLMLNIHHTRASDIVVPDVLTTNPSVPLTFYRDAFGNWCTRIVAPPGQTRLTASAIVNDSGVPEPRALSDRQHAVEDLPEECLQFLLGSRYCETDRLSDVAWSLFGKRRAARSGFRPFATTCISTSRSATRTPARRRRRGKRSARRRASAATTRISRVTFCRCMNIPARYCTGYLGDVGVPPPYGPMDFAAWFEAYVDGHWHTFDPRNNVPRIGRILIARGRDATDVAISNAFGPNTLVGFKVWVDEIGERHTS